MRIGIVELFLIFVIASITIGPTVAVWVGRWMRRAEQASAAEARRRAAAQAQRIAEREAVLHRFQVLGTVFAAVAAVLLIYALTLRPIDAEPQPYTPPAVRAAAGQTAQPGGTLGLEGYEAVSGLRLREGWLYLAAQRPDGGVIARVREDGSGLAPVLTVPGEVTGFDFGPEGELWFTVLTEAGGMLCRAGYDGWGATVEQVVTQIDGRALASVMAVAVGADGRVYFAEAASTRAPDGAAAALRSELMAHTATGSVYVYDPAGRTVERVLGGVAGAAGLALAPDGGTLYVSDLGGRCIWAVDPAGRELTAGGRRCTQFAGALPGYPGALAVDADGTLYVSYRWARSGWLEDHAGGTLLRGAALRLSLRMQEGLFGLPGAGPAAEALDAQGGPVLAFAGGQEGGASAVYAAESRVYLGIEGQPGIAWLRI